MAEDRQISPAAQPQRIGSLLDSTFRDYRNHFRYWFLAAACVLLPWLILNAIFEPRLQSSLNEFVQSQMNALARNQAAMPTAGSILHVVPSVEWVLGLLKTFIVTPLLYGILLHFVTEHKLFETTVTIDESFSKTLRRLWPVAITNIFWWFLVAVGSGLSILIIFGAALTHNASLVVLAVILLTLILIILAIWIGIRMSFISTVTLEERLIGWKSFSRSWALTRRKFWRTFGFLLLMGIIAAVLQGGIATLIAVLVPNNILSAILSGLLSLFVTPLLLLARANLYTDLRIRTDAADLTQWLRSTEDTN